MNKIALNTGFTLLCLLQTLIASAQWDHAVLSLSEVMESLTEQENGIDPETLLQTLEDLKEDPPDLNSASFEELSAITWLTPQEIESILNYRNKTGPIVSLSELAYIEGLTPGLIETLLPFVCIRSQEKMYQRSLREMLQKGNHQIRTQIRISPQVQAGDRDTTRKGYEGSPLYQVTRYQFSNNRYFSIGFTGEKDSRESFFSGSNPSGYDFWSFHTQVKNLGKIKNFIIGDYKAWFGQGLVFCPGFSLGKTSMTQNIGGNANGITPYRSPGEYGFFRGAAVTLAAGNTELTLLYSHRDLDANVSEWDQDGNPSTVSSIQNSGLHRTQNEIDDEKTEEERLAGFHLIHKRNALEIGLTGLVQHLGLPVIPRPQPYNINYFRGDQAWNTSIDYRYRHKNLILFGEMAKSQEGIAGLQGIQFRMSPGLDFSILFRHYQPGYHSPYSGAFGENARNNNETGLYFGLSRVFSSRWTLKAYADYAYFPRPKYRVDEPSSSIESLVRAEYTPSSSLKISLQYKIRGKQENNTTEKNPAEKIIRVWTSNLSGQMLWKPPSGWWLKTSLNGKLYRKGNSSSQGIMIAQDFGYSAENQWGFILRGAWFNTGDYNSRVYLYENDLSYSFNIPAFYDEGFRVYLITDCQITRTVKIQCKAGMTKYFHLDQTGSGESLIQGSYKSEIRIQILCKI